MPRFRGLGRAAILLNRAMLRLGASPTDIAEMRDGTRIRVDLRAPTERLAFYSGRYDPELVEAVIGLFEPNGAFLDVGANIGFYSVAVGNHVRRSLGRGRVFAFEPLEANFNRHVENVRLNGLDEICSAVKTGLSSANGAGRLRLGDDFANGAATGNATIGITPDSCVGSRTVPVVLRRLDDLWPELATDLPIDLVKVDIEGHEDHFLEGAAATLARHRPTILMEVNRYYYRTRGLDLDTRFQPLIPPDYLVLLLDVRGWKRLASFAPCAELDDVFLVPRERLSLPRYRRIAADLEG